MYQQDEIESALPLARSICDIVIVTRGAKGSLIATETETLKIDAVPVNQVIDTTGAGDLFAAGFLFGFTHGCGINESAKIGSAMAAEDNSHVGTRPRDGAIRLNVEFGINNFLISQSEATLEPTTKRIRVLFAGEVIADSTQVQIMYDTSHVPVYYFPMTDVRMDLMEPTHHKTH